MILGQSRETIAYTKHYGTCLERLTLVTTVDCTCASQNTPGTPDRVEKVEQALACGCELL